MTVNFSTQVNRLGFYLSTGGDSTWLVEIFNNNNQLLGSNSYVTNRLNPNIGAAFVGFEFTENINYFRVSQTISNNFVFVMDDLRYEAVNSVPTSPVLALIMMGFLYLLKIRTLRR